MRRGGQAGPEPATHCSSLWLQCLSSVTSSAKMLRRRSCGSPGTTQASFRLATITTLEGLFTGSSGLPHFCLNSPSLKGSAIQCTASLIVTWTSVELMEDPVASPENSRCEILRRLCRRQTQRHVVNSSRSRMFFNAVPHAPSCS